MPTHLDLLHVCLDSADPAGPIKRPFAIDYDDTAIFEAPHDHLETLGDVALDEARHAFSSESLELVGREGLLDQLSSSEIQRVDMLNDDPEEAVLLVGEVCRQPLHGVRV